MSAQPAHRLDFNAAKEISLSNFLEQQLGVTGRKMGSSLRFSSCPNCGPSNDDSTKLAVSKDDRTFKCFSCGEDGSTIDAAMHLWKCTAVQAVEQLLGQRSDFKSCDRPKRDRAVEEAELAAKTIRMREAFSIIQDVCSGFRDEPDPLNYLVHERKIPLSLAREAQNRGMVGFLPSDPNLARKILLDSVGENLLRETGLWKPDTALPGICYRPLVFFLPNMSSAEFRHIGPSEGGWTKSIRYGVLEYPYFWEGDSNNAQCMVVEGMIDLLSSVALGYTGHVLGLTGCNTFIESWFPKAAARYGLKRYVIALDNDVDKPDKNPGQVWAAKLKELITEQGIPCTIKVPESGDINDILKAKAT